LVNGFLRPFALVDGAVNIVAANYLFDNDVSFAAPIRISKARAFRGDGVSLCVSPNAFVFGIHSWSLRVTECDIYRQEIGVIERLSVGNARVMVDDGGIAQSPWFGARAFIGSELCCSGGGTANYCAAFDSDGSTRCQKQISTRIGWCTGDIIRAELDLRRGSITFSHNDEKMQTALSIQTNCTYFPFIAFQGRCKYELIDFK